MPKVNRPKKSQSKKNAPMLKGNDKMGNMPMMKGKMKPMLVINIKTKRGAK